MGIKTVVIIIISWIVLNVVVPVFVRSVERQFQKQIDFFVFKLLKFFKILPLGLLKVFLIILFLPGIILFKVSYKCFPKIYNFELFRINFDFFNGILSKDFRKNYKKLFKDVFIVQPREQKEIKRRDQK